MHSSHDQTRHLQARAAFHRDLIAEALDEAAFLYAQAKLVSTSEDSHWTDAEDFEARLEANLELLEDPELFPPLDALEKPEEPGTLYAVIRALCFQGRLEELLNWLGSQALAEPAQCQAACDALRDGLPVDWLEPALETLWSSHPPLACHLMGIRPFFPGGDRLLTHSETTPVWAWALGRMQLPGTQDMLKGTLLHQDPEVARQAALALLRMGEADFLKHPPEGNPGWFAMAQALAHKAPVKGDSPDHLFAIGLVGNPDGIATLLKALDNPELAPAAAKGLYALTGASLRESVLVPVEGPLMKELAQNKVAEKALIDELIDVLIEAPMEAAEELPEESEGEERMRLAQNPDLWQAWWEGHRSNFSSGTLYRLGKPSTPLWLLATLASPETPQWLRSLTFEELQICHGIDLLCDLDCQVKTQKDRIEKNEGYPVSPFARRIILQEGWKTAMIRGAHAQPRGIQKPAAEPAPSPDSRGPVKEGWKTAMVRSVKAQESGVQKPPIQAVPPPDNRGPVKEGWKTAMIRSAKAQEAGVQKPAVQSGPPPDSRGPVQEGWKTAMIRSVKAQDGGIQPQPDRLDTPPEGWRTVMIRIVRGGEKVERDTPAVQPTPPPDNRGAVKEGWKTAMIRGHVVGPKKP